ncbi:MAG: hypothetical protein K2X47_09125 [Bdellovibrionales bacterium]|nr:hypothetical protein [Bdellovibrionales bacterium]
MRGKKIKKKNGAEFKTDICFSGLNEKIRKIEVMLERQNYNGTLGEIKSLRLALRGLENKFISHQLTHHLGSESLDSTSRKIIGDLIAPRKKRGLT